MEMNVPLRYAQHVAFVSAALLFSGFIPLLVVLLPFYFFVYYYIDKLLMYRLCKVPPRYENRLNTVALNLLGIGVMLHVCMNIWVFSNQLIFPNEVFSTEPENGVTYYYVEDYSFWERVFSINGLPFFILLCTCFFSLFLCSPVLQSLAFACFFSASTKRGS
mmetsp:Transcript_32060/g.23694  ORF Transcript_32060/g.23694 Transcript_32060/m.23694 type:complete len:162 (+) Transcript_32060:40-525(+)